MGPQARLEAARWQLDVGVRKRHILASCHAEAGVARFTWKGGARQLDDRDLGEPLTNDLGGLVTTTRDDDRLKRLRTLLRDDRGHAASDDVFVVAGDDDCR